MSSKTERMTINIVVEGPSAVIETMQRTGFNVKKVGSKFRIGTSNPSGPQPKQSSVEFAPAQ